MKKSLLLVAAIALIIPSHIQASEQQTVSLEEVFSELSMLRAIVTNQQRQIEQLQKALITAPAPVASAAAPEQLEDVSKKVDTVAARLAGFRFSGDFRFRADVQARHGNDIAGPLQNVRSRYRLRLNIDKEIDPKFRFHVQFSTGPLNNPITNDQDFAGMAVKHPFSIAEAYVDYRPSARLSLRGGRMEEVFADNMRFVWDDDVRFNGFQQIATLPLGEKSRLEVRSGEYFLSNPNVTVLSPQSSFATLADYQAGQKVRDANLFHPGLVLAGDLGTRWSQQAIADIQLYRNQNQIALSTTVGGVPLVINNAIGLTLSGPVSAVGNATTQPGGAIYTAPRYQVARLAYRITNRGIKIAGREMPFFVDVQALRNVGTDQLRDAIIASANFGEVRRFGDFRLLYQFAIKDANSMIAQFTDDDLGTGSTTNLATHAVRFDLGLTPALQWQNLFFIQNARRANDPAQQFFVPVQRGANTTYRYLGQLSFSF